MGEYRVFNQFAQQYSVTELANMVDAEANKLELQSYVTNIENPRNEMEVHYYNPDHEELEKLGYVPSLNTEELISEILIDLAEFSNRVVKYRLMPEIQWR
jgi:UDP-sulfoquinovose synthase